MPERLGQEVVVSIGTCIYAHDVDVVANGKPHHILGRVLFMTGSNSWMGK
ncbi:hypothetical protein MAE02_66250 [Microvirga aerophila]|uniref:Uncharacterized protein n=1 Tax=Microvirga aerophila TaxID=670291 RepID=A0A512C3Y8_9HYPH|nr:hypothetical protein MAE02_66250 [Microvirga aerophila]